MVIYRSALPDVSFPDVPLTEHILEGSASRADKPALIDGLTGRTVTYRELDELSARVAAALIGDGLHPGDVVAVIGLNQPFFAVACYAALRAGAVVTPINPLLTASEINKQLRDSDATTVIGTVAIEDRITAATVGAQAVRRYTLEGSGPDSLADLATAQRTALPAVEPNSTAALLYSSGTTGTSKGVMLSHRNLVASLEQLRASWQLNETDVLCAALPLFHVYGFNVILNSALLAGATLITLPRFDLRTYLGVVEKFRVTRGHFVPPILLGLADAPEVDEFDLSSMYVAVSGAAPLDENIAHRVTERIGVRVVQGYGMTEAIGTHATDDADVDVPVSSIGKLLASTEARLVSPETGRDAEAGQAGEMWIRGPQVMQGYRGQPEATAATVTEGWLRTGDIVEIRDGNFYIVDRLKELIKYNGFQVAPAELEAVLSEHPQVFDVAVVGRPDPTAGEVPKAFVVPNGSINADELIEWTAARVASYKKIREIEFINQIPRSATGKILRRVLKDTVPQQKELSP